MSSDARVSHWSECPVCRSDDRGVFVEREQFTFVRCICGLVYKSRDETPVAEQPRAAWNERYIKRRRHRVAKARRQILDLLNHVEPGPLFDIGCSLGYALQAAADLGLAAKGIDVNQDVLEVCRERGFDVEFGDVQGPYAFADGSFRLAILKHVLEHAAVPRAALRELRRVLEPGGGSFIAVPNLDYYKAMRSPETYHFFNPGRGGTQHYVYYTPAHLSRLLAEEGFRTVRVHPHLWQRRGSWGTHAANLVAMPFRAIGRPVRTLLRLRREFWLVAVRES
jgi:SAM-dependent methyltransferase